MAGARWLADAGGKPEVGERSSAAAPGPGAVRPGRGQDEGEDEGEGEDGVHAGHKLERERDPRLHEAGIRRFPRSVRGRCARGAGGPRPPGPDPPRGARPGGLARRVLPGRAARVQRRSGYTRGPEPERVETSLDEPRFDVEGRFVAARFRPGGGGRLAVVNCYFPKGSGKDRDNSRVPYKLDFYRAVFERAEDLRREGPVLVIGDYNTAHREIDLARPRANVKNSGFLPEERAELDRWLEAGWIDTFRALHPDEPDHYSWWAPARRRPPPATWAGGSTTCSPRRRRWSGSGAPSSGRTSTAPTTARSGVDIDLQEPAPQNPSGSC